MENTRSEQKRRAHKERQAILSRTTYSVLGLDEGIVDGNNLDVGVLDGVAEDDAADATEAVDADLSDHFEGR